MIDFSAFSMNKELDLVKHNFIPFNPTINLCYIRTDWIRPEAPISLSVLSGVFVKCINSLTYPGLKCVYSVRTEDLSDSPILQNPRRNI